MELCKKDPSLAAIAEEFHNLRCTGHQLRQVHNLFLEPMLAINRDLRYYQTMDKVFALTIMCLGTFVPMMHMFSVPRHLSVAVSSLIPILQGINMNLQPGPKAQGLARVRALCLSEGHHFLSLTGEYHESDHHEDHEIKHFLEMVSTHRSAATKPTKKDKKKKGDKKDKK
eukprot:TRINITY_DN15225_c0_g1_i1.p1 TRINITY_DN15225_c0_g1~~TRINITY_DN15225_c0_g1_i1.p1  ORF type:complete len:170 (-),score=24.25 TRINITY_DN15225_c0_g1_i1:9-518(-)